MSTRQRHAPRFQRPAEPVPQGPARILELLPQKSGRCSDARLAVLAGLAAVEIETSLVKDLSGSLHDVFDDTCEKALPIYFGPLLGRLFLEGL